jgi:hypothetical protein
MIWYTCSIEWVNIVAILLRVPLICNVGVITLSGGTYERYLSLMLVYGTYYYKIKVKTAAFKQY